MAKLILSLDGSVIREIPLDKERVTIGRKAQNDIPIENLAVSGEHACIVTILKDSFLEDLGSTNGTLVNGNPVKKHILQNNDVIEIGKYKLKYMVEASAPPVAEGRPAPVVSAAAAPPVQTAPAAAAEVARPGEAMLRPTIQILNGASAGRELELTKNLTTLGKPGVQVAVITRRPQGYFIAHVEGASFPIVNGKALDAQAHPLNDHDIVELAGVKMEFFFKKSQA
jgi:predicted component of type VI protein secretion system